MSAATSAVLERQATINGSLEDLRARRGQNGRGDPGDLTPVDLRTAAYVLAVDRVARVTLDRGIWP